MLTGARRDFDPLPPARGVAVAEAERPARLRRRGGHLGRLPSSSSPPGSRCGRAKRAAVEQRRAVPSLLPSGELGEAATLQRFPACTVRRAKSGARRRVPWDSAMRPRRGDKMGSSQTASILRREPGVEVLELELHHGRGGSDRSMRVPLSFCSSVCASLQRPTSPIFSDA